MATKFEPKVKPLKKAIIPEARKRPERAAAREAAMAQTPDDRTDEQVKRDKLAGTVASRIREAIAARHTSGIEAIWADDEDQYNGIDALSAGPIPTKSYPTPPRNAQDTSNTNGRSRVFLNITEPKTDAAIARIQEMLVPNDDKPWEFKPTPIPEMDDAIEAGDSTPVQLQDGTSAPAADVAEIVRAKAAKSCKKMELWVEDKLVEGDVYAELRAVIRDAGRRGTGVLKGPFAVARKDRKWSKLADGVRELVVTVKNSPTSKCVDVRDCFPDPSCGDNIHNGSYFVERDYLTVRQLRELSDVEGYDREAIALALQEGPKTRARDYQRREQIGESLSNSEVFEAYYYYGDMTVDDLLIIGNMGADALTDKEVQLLTIPCIVTMINERPIKTVVSPAETGEFPFDFFPWKPISNQPYGRGVPNKIGAAQRMLNAGVRRLMENAGISGGPQVAFIEGALKPVNGRYEVVGPKLWKFNPTAEVNDINKAMAVFNIPSMQVELSAIIQFALKMADELTNLPLLLQGINKGEDSPDTLGGMKMLMNNANAPLRVIAKQFDDFIVVPHLRRYYDAGMASEDVPDSAKGDHRVMARGSTALIQREIAREFLMQLYPVSKDPALKIDPAKLAGEMAKSNGYSLATVQYTDEEWAKVQQDAQANPPPGDPRIEAARIRNEGMQAKSASDAKNADIDRQFRAQQADLERQFKDRIEQVEFQIEQMKLAAAKNIRLSSVKSMLAGKAMDATTKREEMNLKLNAANPSHMGI